MKRNFLTLFALTVCLNIDAYSQHLVNSPIELYRGSGGQKSFIRNNHNPRIWSTANDKLLSYPFRDFDLGHLVLQPRTSALRDILFVTGDGDDIRMAIKGNGSIGINL